MITAAVGSVVGSFPLTVGSDVVFCALVTVSGVVVGTTTGTVVLGFELVGVVILVVCCNVAGIDVEFVVITVSVVVVGSVVSGVVVGNDVVVGGTVGFVVVACVVAVFVAVGPVDGTVVDEVSVCLLVCIVVDSASVTGCIVVLIVEGRTVVIGGDEGASVVCEDCTVGADVNVDCSLDFIRDDCTFGTEDDNCTFGTGVIVIVVASVITVVCFAVDGKVVTTVIVAGFAVVGVVGNVVTLLVSSAGEVPLDIISIISVRFEQLTISVTPSIRVKTNIIILVLIILVLQ